MKCAIAYVIGDTALHDKLCGKYGSHSAGVNKLCRHCNCSTNTINIRFDQTSIQLWLPEDVQSFPDDHSASIKEWFQKNSHHPFRNVFHQLNFSCNMHNIHLSTPGECLHMHQLGLAKRAVESTATVNSIGYLAQHYGSLLLRQSDRNFPRTKFGTHLLSTTKKEGNDYA
eukprot:12952018-Ditylum_brightwellii.AAC.1